MSNSKDNIPQKDLSGLKPCQVHLPEWLWRQVGSSAKLRGVEIREYVKDALLAKVRSEKAAPIPEEAA